jgi:hypothetical protein
VETIVTSPQFLNKRTPDSPGQKGQSNAQSNAEMR